MKRLPSHTNNASKIKRRKENLRGKKKLLTSLARSACPSLVAMGYADIIFHGVFRSLSLQSTECQNDKFIAQV